MLNRVLDVAISTSVTEHQRQRVNATADDALQHIGALAHELRNALSAAVMSFSVIKQGVVGTRGDTLDRSLRRMGDLHDRTMAEALCWLNAFQFSRASDLPALSPALCARR